MAKKILFVDDDKLVARIYGEKLAEDGFEVSVAEDGVQAMKRLVEFKPDLVVLDLLMPKLNGADVLKFMREHKDFKHTHVIVFSNSFLAALVEQVGALGVDGVMPKSSATPVRLIEFIHRTLNGPAPVPLPDAPPLRALKEVPPHKPALKIINEAVRSESAKPPKPAKSPATPATPAAPPAVAEVSVEKKDEQFRTRVQEEFVKHLPLVLADIRQLSRALFEAADEKKEQQIVEHLSRKVGFLTQMASMAKRGELAMLANALELLFYHLQEKKSTVNDSCRNTIAAAVSFLSQHLERFEPVPETPYVPPTVLVVDDDMVSNRGAIHALSHANFKPTGETDPLKALEKLKQTPYDLILLDVEMQGMDGVALCEKIRGLELHRRTPVIFVTSHSGGKVRARSVLSGGNDFITKPFLPIELTVKLITLMLKNRAGETTTS